MGKIKFYAVLLGREGPKIYNNWYECEKNVTGWPGARHKSFSTREQAQAWLEQSHNSCEMTIVNDVNTQSVNEDSSPTFTSQDVSLDLEPFTADFIPLTEPGGVRGFPRSISSPISTNLLSEEQEHILELAREGKNIFFTGSAGTGKSVLLRSIIDHLGGEISEELAITASTGIAAVNIGGTTLHSFAGIGLGAGSTEGLIDKIISNKKSKQRWRRTRTLIIDEISMVDGCLFDKLEYIARNIRGNEKPFGGIQLVLSGDFCQLPPVPERLDGVSMPTRFAFEAKSWDKCFDGTQSSGSMYRLTKVFRQKDQTFVNMLNSMRSGRLNEATVEFFHKLSRPVKYSDGLEPCELFPRREQVHDANQERLRRLHGTSQTYRAMDVGGYDTRGQRTTLEQAKKLLDRLVAPETIEFKVGAQVMLIKNLTQGHLVNGSLGQIVDFQSLGEAHGCNTEVANVDRSSSLSAPLGRRRGKNTPLDTNDLSVHTDNVWPVVRFTSGKELLLTPAEFEVVNVHGTMEARRDQVPLILAWALSIHKSQGQTLERVKVDLGKTFEKGQAYVALSRATNMDGLQVLNFHPSKVMAHPRVLTWQEQVKWNCMDQVSPSHILEHSNKLGIFGTSQVTHFESVSTSPASHDEFDEFDTPEALASYWDVDLAS